MGESIADRPIVAYTGLFAYRGVTCPYELSKPSVNHSPRSKAPACICGAPSVRTSPGVRSVSAVRRLPQRQPRRISRRLSRGIRTAASRPSPTCSPARWNTATASAIAAPWGGDVQWMTAGSGILHQEMPKGDEHGRMHGFQLWANLPSSLKMTAPRYQDVVGRGHARGDRRRRHARARSCAASSGARAAGRRRRRRSALPRCVGAAGPAQDAAGRDVAPRVSRTSSPDRERFATRPIRARSRPIASVGGEPLPGG